MKHKSIKRRSTKRRHTKKYRIHGGAAAPLPPPKFTEVPPPLPGDAMGVQDKIAQQNAAQNQANKTLAGGKRSRGKRSRVKRILKHRGGGATICGGSPINGADGYGYVSPNNCLLVPTVNNPSAQALAIDGMNNLNIGASNSAGDRLVGKIR